jgi:hypothetical protein
MSKNESQASRLRRAAAELEGQTMSLQQLFRLHGRAGPGALLVVLSVPCMLPIPGAGVFMSMGMVMVAWMIWRYYPRLVMPRKVGRWKLSATMARRALHTLAWMYDQASRVMRVRMAWWLQPLHRIWLAPLVALLALVIFLPIPFGNVLPAAVLMLIGLGLVFEDGLAILIGVVLGVTLLAVLIALASGMTHWASELWLVWPLKPP